MNNLNNAMRPYAAVVGYTTRGDEGSEGDLTGEDRAEEAGTEDVHDRYGVSWLFVFVHLADPGGKGEDTIAGHGENETGGGDDCDTGTLCKVTSIFGGVK
jgi:hypothetical protein